MRDGIINYSTISVSPSALFSAANLANWTPTAVGLHGTIVSWPRYVVVARRRCLQFDDKVNGIINKANGKRVFAAPCAHLACCGHKRVEEIIRKGPPVPACLPLSSLAAAVLRPGSPNYNSTFVFVKAPGIKATAAMNFALHAIKRGRALINDQTRYMRLSRCVDRDLLHIGARGIVSDRFLPCPTRKR